MNGLDCISTTWTVRACTEWLAPKIASSESHWGSAFMSPPDHIIEQRDSFLRSMITSQEYPSHPSGLALREQGNLKASTFSLEGVWLHIFSAAALGLGFWSTCRWELAGSFQETEEACGHFPGFLSIACSSIKIKSLASLWKELVYVSHTPTFMAATWGMGSQITELKEPTRLKIYQSDRTTLNNNWSF